MTVSIDNVAAQLAALPAGQRAWFWFCPQLADDQPLLLLRHFKLDPRQEALQADIAAISLPDGALPIRGVAHSDGDGALSFGGPLLGEEDLRRLAGWAGGNVADHPGLARLKGARFVRTSLNGRVTAMHADDSLWDALPAPKVPGSLAEAAALLPMVKPGRSYWFWLTDAGPGGRPWLVLGSSKRDADGSLFAQKVAAVSAQCDGAPTVVRGVLRAREDGSLLFTSTDPVVGPPQVALAKLIAATGEQMPRLASSRLAQVEGGSFRRVVSPDAGAGAGAGAAVAEAGPDYAAQAAALSGIGEGKLAFWFSADGGHLELDADRAALKARVSDRGAPMAAGSVQRAKGYLLFQAKRPAPGFVDALAAWAGAHYSRNPGLRALEGARFMARDRDGNTTDRQKNDTAWAAAFGEEG